MASLNQQQTIHTIPSHIGGLTKHFSRKQQRVPLEYDKYLVGRSYQLFKSAIHSEKTLQLYKQHLFHFCDFAQMTTEEVVSKYGSSGSDKNVKESIKLQQIMKIMLYFYRPKFEMER